MRQSVRSLAAERSFCASVCSWHGPFEILRWRQQFFDWILLWDVEISGRLLISVINISLVINTLFLCCQPYQPRVEGVQRRLNSSSCHYSRSWIFRVFPLLEFILFHTYGFSNNVVIAFSGD